METNNTQPPSLARKILFFFLRQDLAEEVEGDLAESFYHHKKSYGTFKAKMNYWYQVLNYLRPFAIRKSNYLNPLPMFQHNLLISFRSFARNKTTFFINLIGLSSGLACALLIYLWVNDELSMDKFHSNDRLMQVMQRMESAGGVGVTYSTPWLLAETLADEIPEVEHAVVTTPIDWFEGFTLSVGEKAVRATGKYVGSDYFSMFSYPLIEGGARDLLMDKNSIVITRDLAKRLFDTSENVVGKVIEFQHETEFKITGVLENIPSQSSVQFDFAIPIKLFIDQYPQVTSWKNSGPETYVTLKEGTDINIVQSKIKDIIKAKSDDTHRTLFLRPYADAYLYDHYEDGVQSGGRIEYVNLFSIIAIFILIIACINFMNLATAKATRRVKEVGVKKSVGANRFALVFQYLGESTLVSLFALMVAIGLTYLTLPRFNLITGKALSLSLSPSFILILLGITILTGLLAGSYPALYLSGFRPAQILKGKLNNSIGELWTRKGLVLFQFTLSILFIVSVLIIYKQLDYVQNRNLGYNKENILYFDIEGEIKNKRETFINELKRIPGVAKAASIGQSMVGGGNTSGIEWEGKDPSLLISFAYRPVSFDALDMLDLELKEGRLFQNDHNDSLAVIFNEAGIQAMSMTNPIGKVIKLGPYQCPIIGVVKDFHFESMHTNVKPMFFILAPEHTRKVMVKIASGNERETLERIQEFYTSFNPGFAFNFRFLDQDYQEQYKSELRVSLLSRYFAGLAILISCLGLFGLASYTTERRKKEIGIRKVMGSNEWGIIYLLSKDFTRIVIVSAFIALPISYFIAKDWLNNFAYHIPLEVWYFLSAAASVLLIALLTVSTQAFKASRINPAQCLKDE